MFRIVVDRREGFSIDIANCSRHSHIEARICRQARNSCDIMANRSKHPYIESREGSCNNMANRSKHPQMEARVCRLSHCFQKKTLKKQKKLKRYRATTPNASMNQLLQLGSQSLEFRIINRFQF